MATYATLQQARKAAQWAADAAQDTRYVVRERGESSYSVASGFDLDTFYIGCSADAIHAEVEPRPVCDCGRRMLRAADFGYWFCRVCES